LTLEWTIELLEGLPNAEWSHYPIHLVQDTTRSSTDW